MSVLLKRLSRYFRYYSAESFNSRAKGTCVEQFANNGGRKHFSEANNPAACAAANGVWTEYQSMLELAPQFTTPAAVSSNDSIAV